MVSMLGASGIKFDKITPKICVKLMDGLVGKGKRSLKPVTSEHLFERLMKPILSGQVRNNPLVNELGNSIRNVTRKTAIYLEIISRQVENNALIDRNPEEVLKEKIKSQLSQLRSFSDGNELFERIIMSFIEKNNLKEMQSILEKSAYRYTLRNAPSLKEYFTWHEQYKELKDLLALNKIEEAKAIISKMKMVFNSAWRWGLIRGEIVGLAKRSGTNEAMTIFNAITANVGIKAKELARLIVEMAQKEEVDGALKIFDENKDEMIHYCNGDLPYSENSLSMAAFKKEHNNNNTDKNIADFMVQNGVTENATVKTLLSAFNKFISQNKADYRTGIGNKQKLAKIYPRTLEKSYDSSYKEEAVEALTIGLAKLGKTDEAKTFMRENKLSDRKQCDLWCELAKSFYRQGDPKRANKELEAAELVVESYSDDSDKNYGKYKIGEAFIDIGDSKKARSLVDGMLNFVKEKRYENLWLYRELVKQNLFFAALILLRMDKVDNALEIIKKIKEDKDLFVELDYQCAAPFLVRSLVSAALILLKMDKADNALEIIKETPLKKGNYWEHYGEIMAIIGALAEKGRVEEAFQIAQEHNLKKDAYSIILKELEKDPEIGIEKRKALLHNYEKIEAQLLCEQKIRELKKEEEVKQEKEKVRREKEERIISRLNSKDSSVRDDAIHDCLRERMSDHRAFGSIAEALKDGKIEFIEGAEALARINERDADGVIMKLLKEKERNLPEDLWLFNEYDLKKTERFIKRKSEEEKRENALREELENKLENVCKTIKSEICSQLGLEPDSYEVEPDAGVYYGQVASMSSMVMRMSMRMSMDRTHHTPGFLRIGTGETNQEIKERIQTLNFLAHHEIAHLIFERLGIKPPSIKAEYPCLNDEWIAEEQEELLADKIAFVLAKDIYVGKEGGSGKVFSVENKMERIFISFNAHLTLSQIVFRNLKLKKHSLSDECIIRIIAVLRENAKVLGGLLCRNTDVFQKLKSSIEKMAGEFEKEFVSGQEPKKKKEMLQLIEKFKETFEVEINLRKILAEVEKKD